jgi:hypothetical protein
MKRRFFTDTIFRVFLRPGRGASLDKQREAAKAVVPLGATVMEVTETEMLSEMTRKGDVVIVYRLEFIPPARSKECPSPAFVMGEVRAALRGNVLIESYTGAEPDKKRWLEAIRNVKHGQRRVYRTERLKAGGKTRGEQVTRESQVNYWLGHPERERFRAIWMSRAYPNALAAVEAVNAECERCKYQRIGSADSARRAFGGRK